MKTNVLKSNLSRKQFTVLFKQTFAKTVQILALNTLRNEAMHKAYNTFINK
jgi:hypothetical protein